MTDTTQRPLYGATELRTRIQSADHQGIRSVWVEAVLPFRWSAYIRVDSTNTGRVVHVQSQRAAMRASRKRETIARFAQAEAERAVRALERAMLD